MKRHVTEMGLALFVGLSVLQLFDALQLFADFRAQERRERELERIRREHLERMTLETAVALEPDPADDAPPAE